MDRSDLELRQSVLLVFQVALLGMVRPTLRGVTVGWTDRRIVGRCIFDGPIGDRDREDSTDVEGEVAASFPSHEVEVTARRADYPRELNSELLTAWVYVRNESDLVPQPRPAGSP